MSKPKPPEMKCPDPLCGWHIVWFQGAKDGVMGSCYDCGWVVDFEMEQE